MTLAEATEQLYAAFADMPKPTQIHDPYGELQAGEVRQLTTYPLQELSAGLLTSYLDKAVYTDTWDDFRYFLPRLLELIAAYELESYQILWRMRHAQENQLPFTERQRQALYDFGLSYWWQRIAIGGVGVSIWDLEEWQIIYGLPRQKLLTEWFEHPEGAVWIANAAMSRGFPEEWDIEETRALLETAFHSESNPEDAEVISNAVLILESMLPTS